MKRIGADTWNTLKRIVWTLLFVLIGLDVYDRFLRNLLSGDNRLLSFIVLWLFTAYFVLPRIHRTLTKLYLPDYFIGRVRTNDGLLADPVNLALNGRQSEIKQLFKEAGWTEADPVTLKSSWRIVTDTIMKRSYPSAPVSPLFLFGEQQHFAFQKEIDGNPKARHHIRFWKAPAAWWLPGGRKVDFLAAATYDRSVGFSLFTGQITHKIAENTDYERDFVWQSLNPKRVEIEELEHFMTVYRGRTGGGDNIRTNGTLVIVSAIKS